MLELRIICLSIAASFITALMRLLLDAPSSVESQQNFSTFAGHIVTDVIVPNLVWKGGRCIHVSCCNVGMLELIHTFSFPELQLQFVQQV